MCVRTTIDSRRGWAAAPSSEGHPSLVPMLPGFRSGCPGTYGPLSDPASPAVVSRRSQRWHAWAQMQQRRGTLPCCPRRQTARGPAEGPPGCKPSPASASCCRACWTPTPPAPPPSRATGALTASSRWGFQSPGGVGNTVLVMQECDLDQAFERSPSGCPGHRRTAVVPGLPLPFLLAGSSNVVHGCFFLLLWAVARCSRPCAERKGACRSGAGSCLHASLVGGTGLRPRACQRSHAEQACHAGKAVAPAKQAAAAVKLGWTGCPTGASILACPLHNSSADHH